MISRCIYCGDVCPDFSEVCNCCAYIEKECRNEMLKIEYFIYNDPLNHIPIIKEKEDE